MEKKRLPLNAVHLRYLALALMLLDHMWATVVPGNLWMTCVGRLAFPIFAFQAAEGYAHTSNFKQYCMRLLLFGLISEIPFNWMLSSSWIYPFHQNVMFTLLLGLLALRAMERAKDGKLWWLLAAFGCCLLGAVTFVDYGAYGVMMVLIFGLSRRMPYAKLFQLAALILINVVMMEGQMLILFGWELPVQSFAVLALLPNGSSRSRASRFWRCCPSGSTTEKKAADPKDCRWDFTCFTRSIWQFLRRFAILLEAIGNLCYAVRD